MYTPGKIIYFDPFYFKNGGSSKPKYFLVLKSIDQSAILASLPTSKHHLPSNLPINHGCISMPSSCINCYIFKSQVEITKCGWSFELDTYLYGQWLDEYSLEILNDIYQVEGIEYNIIGELKEDELQKVIYCFSNSNVVKRKFKKILSA